MRVQAIGLKPPWQPGDVVGRYVLVARIAVGGMAEIWLAQQSDVPGSKKIVAIKKISDSLCAEPEFVEMFLDEARIAAQLNHPNIVQIFDLGEHAGSYYIAMEYLHGEDLAHVVRGGLIAKRPLPVSFAVRIITQAAEALDYAHSKVGIDGVPLHIIHRDVSPQNLIVTYDGRVKMVDFGIAKAANRSTATVAGQLKGKLSYMSPEQARGEPIDTRSDIFTLGVVLWESLTRSRLFRFEDAFQALAAVASDNPILPPSQKNPAIPPELDAIAAKALERDKSKRFQSVGELQLALDEWLGAEEGRDPSAAEIASYMREVFRDRIAQRVRLLETALTSAPKPALRRRPSQPEVEVRPTPAPPPRMEVRPTPAPLPRMIDSLDIEHTAPFRYERGRRSKFTAAVIAILAVTGLGYQFRRQIPVILGPAQKTHPVAPVPEFKNQVDIETDPDGAELLVDGERKGSAPLSLRNLKSGDHRLVASLPEHSSVSRTIRLDKAGQHVTVVLSLPPSPVPPPVAVAHDETSQLASPTNPTPKPPSPRGKLTLDTIPWSEVFLGDRKLGDTPLYEVSIPAGRHTLRLVNDERHIKSQVQIEIQPGKTTIKKLQL